MKNVAILFNCHENLFPCRQINGKSALVKMREYGISTNRWQSIMTMVQFSDGRPQCVNVSMTLSEK